MDKVQKIKEWISKTQDGLMDNNGNFEYPEHEGAYNILCNLDAYIDSLQEEPVSEGLEKASEHLSTIYAGEGSVDPKREGFAFYIGFKNGAQWQKEQIMKDAIDTTIKQGCIELGVLIKGLDKDKFNFGDKVKVIIIKDD